LDAPPVLASASLEAPVTAGIRKSIIILPERLFESAHAELLTAAIGHEMAHIRRRDFLLNLVYELIYLPISFHPAAWFIKRHLVRTREQACDEVVTERLIEPRVYARSLVRIAGSMSALESPACTLGIFDDDNLEERIMKIIRKRPRARLARVSLIIATLALVVSAVAASAFSLNIGQQTGPTAGDIAGTWQLFPSNDSDPDQPPGPGITIILTTDAGKIRGKAIVEVHLRHPDRPEVEKKTVEWVLIDPQFDGTNFTFKVSPADKDSANTSDYITGRLKMAGEEFVGRWESSHGESGALRMARKKGGAETR
jgi:hypothetical protein